jgi:hypothetical protein
MTKLEITKLATKTIVGIGTGKIVHGIIATNVPSGGIVTKVTVIAAAIVVGMMASEKTEAFTDQKIDEAATWWKENVTN